LQFGFDHRGNLTQMAEDNWTDLVARLQARGIAFDPGLSDAEVNVAESRFGFRFPPDLRAFLQTALPLRETFPNWRSGKEVALRDCVDRPRERIVLDSEYNAFWLDEWGPRPDTLERAVQIAEEPVAAPPRLIPIYAPRMLPDSPCLPGNPVFSVHQ